VATIFVGITGQCHVTSMSGKLPRLEEFLPQSRRSQKSFYLHVPLVTSFFDLFDFAVNFFFKVCCFKHSALGGIVTLKKVHDVALGE
jgi:hypothetical protein